MGDNAACNGPECFVAGTLIHMFDGSTKPVEKVKPGDMVISRDPATAKTEINRVLARVVHDAHDLVVLHFGDKMHGKEVDKVSTTSGHPFYAVGRGFVPAGQLAVGNSIVTRAGPPVVVVRIDRIHEAKPVPVYNFTIQDDHTYFVGSANGGEWVHNVNDCGGAQTLNRYMSEGELKATQPPTGNGLLRGGRGGPDNLSYATNDVYNSASEAQSALALPNTPQYGVTFQVPGGTFGDPSMVMPDYGFDGGGIEFTSAAANIPAQIINVWELGE